MSKESYLKLSFRHAPALQTDIEKEAVYAIYEAYERRKKKLNEWDDIDRCVRMRNLLMEDEILWQRIQNVFTEAFVDEIQDQRLPEINFLIRLIQSPKGFALGNVINPCE